MSAAYLLVVVSLAAVTFAAPGNHPNWQMSERLDESEASDPVSFQSLTELEQKWMEFKLTHEKTYSVDEEEVRRKVFAENLKEIDAHNELYAKGLKTYTKGVNQFADLTKAEFVKHISCLSVTNGSETFDRTSVPDELFPNTYVPKSVDWRSRGFVTRVKNQGQCGSCWAFASVAALESLLYLKNRELVYLSEQNVVDCSKRNYGCHGGLPHWAFLHIRDNGGIDTEASYQYEAEDGSCRYDERTKAPIQVKGYVYLPGRSESLLQRAVAFAGPVVVGIDASGFHLYQSGILVDDECSRFGLNHAVLAVGYGTTSPGRDYWILKNSYGTSWGMDGFGLLARNKDNHCGIGVYATYPLVS